MIFKNPPKLTSRETLFKYLESDLWSWARDLVSGMVKMNFLENFESFRVDNLIISAGSEVSIYNQFKNRINGAIPSSRVIVRQQGNGVITDGTTAWTSEAVYLKNEGPSEVKISVIFFK